MTIHTLTFPSPRLRGGWIPELNIRLSVLGDVGKCSVDSQCGV